MVIDEGIPRELWPADGNVTPWDAFILLLRPVAMAFRGVPACLARQVAWRREGGGKRLMRMQMMSFRLL